MHKLKEQIKKIRTSIIAIGFQLNPSQVNIIGSGFCVEKKNLILAAAHLYNQIPNEYKEKIIGMAMVKQEINGLEQYKWSPLKLKIKDDTNDCALFEYENYHDTLLSPLELDDSNNIEVGDDVYFIGFPYAAQLINDGFGITLIANKGMISNIKRDGVNKDHPINWIIVDSISNPGNSGCPLIDIHSNKVIGFMTISFRTKSFTDPKLDIREPMHIAGAKPINLAKKLLKDYKDQKVLDPNIPLHNPHS